MKEKEKMTKTHADFQSKYNRSKNFTTIAKDESLEPTGNGNIKFTSEVSVAEIDKNNIKAALDRMLERI